MCVAHHAPLESKDDPTEGPDTPSHAGRLDFEQFTQLKRKIEMLKRAITESDYEPIIKYGDNSIAGNRFTLQIIILNFKPRRK